MTKPYKQTDARKKFKKFRPVFTSLDRLRRMQRRALRQLQYRKVISDNIAIARRSFNLVGSQGKDAIQHAASIARASVLKHVQRRSSLPGFTEIYVAASGPGAQLSTRYAVGKKYRLKLGALLSGEASRTPLMPKAGRTKHRVSPLRRISNAGQLRSARGRYLAYARVCAFRDAVRLRQAVTALSFHGKRRLHRRLPRRQY